MGQNWLPINKMEKTKLQRFKEGVQAITPFQQTKIMIVGQTFVIVGVIIGLISTYLLSVWWLFIILLGSLIVTATGFLGMIQKYISLKEIYGMKGGVEDELQSTNSDSIHNGISGSRSSFLDGGQDGSRDSI